MSKTLNTLLLSLTLLAPRLSASDLLFDFAPSMKTATLYAESPVLEYMISFSDKGVPSLAPGGKLPVTLTGNCPELAGKSVKIGLFAIGRMNLKNGEDMGESTGVDITLNQAAGGLGIILPTESLSSLLARSVNNRNGRAEGFMLWLDTSALGQNVALKVSGIGMGSFGEENDALTVLEIGGSSIDLLSESKETKQLLTLPNGGIRVRSGRAYAHVLSLFPSGITSSCRLSSIKFSVSTK